MSDAIELRVRGLVQGVGFRPTVWRIATELGLGGDVRNDAEGVLIRLAGSRPLLDTFITRLRRGPPVLARIDAIEEAPLREPVMHEGFRIAPSVPGRMATAIVPDAATCAACLAEVRQPSERRFRYPFTNCTHCGPRLTIIEAAPYDRASTTMRSFAMCPDCAAEYADPADRRFHAQPIACLRCGPAVTLTRLDGRPLKPALDADPVRATAALIARGDIVAVKGLGGFHLACDATDDRAVAELRRRKRRFGKAFAVMMRNLEAVRRYCVVDQAEERLLASPEAPIVLLRAGGERLPEGLAPGLSTLGVMLPYTPLHHLILDELAGPVVMTSGNLSDESQCIEGDEARARLGGIAEHLLDHDRRILNRVDDSVVRFMGGAPTLLRRARGFAPAPVPLPAGFSEAPPILAMGGELKSTFCLLKNGQAIVSQHLGDLENASAFDDYRRTLDLFLRLFDHAPDVIAVDPHPEYLSRKLGERRAETGGLHLAEVQHHHAHVAACLAENGVRLESEPVLGIVLDGLGFGDDGTIWGGEFLLAGYWGYRRLASLRPVAMPGGTRAVREPWRNTLAHILAAMTWSEFGARFAGTSLHAALLGKPVAALESMIRSRTNAPLASSCGRLFDAVAAALGVAFEEATYEGEAAARLEALAEGAVPADPEGYPFGMSQGRDDVQWLEPAPMWRALLADLASGVSAELISARFHKGLAVSVAELAADLLREQGVARTVALSGGCFQNKLLLEEVKRRLEADGVTVLIHAKVPANDGGLSLGQAVVAAARRIAATDPIEKALPCASASQGRSSRSAILSG